jgi:hypothetical protein
MNAFRHWIADQNGDPGVQVVIPDEGTANAYRASDGWTVRGPFVLKDEQLQGAPFPKEQSGSPASRDCQQTETES